ncbi:efflux transporter outer membrane subunit [Sulfuricurvum sp.]|uniref:efflux transporter outer membrane subunit n=1 Tax=Sulfuricurvum sp. TaxID=2025608 RepID=UPI003BB0ED79
MRYKSLLLPCLLALLLFGCVPKIDKAVPISETLIASNLEKSTDLFGSNDGNLVREWWRGYHDRQLDTLLEKALSEAPSLKSIESRYAQANSIIQSVESRNLPHLSANASVLRERFSENHIFPPPLGGSTNNQYQPALILDYDFDFWNARSSRILAAQNQALAQKASIEAAKVALSSAICTAYLSWNHDERKLAILGTLEKTAAEELHILQKKQKIGLIDATQVNTQKSVLSEVMQRISELKRSIEGKKESICVLGGFLPSYADTLKAPHVNESFAVPLPNEIRLNLLSHRADVAISKYIALSKSHTIENAKARFYPDISLYGMIGFTSFSWAKLLERSSYTPSAGIALSLPLLDWGERNANLQNSVSDYNSSVYDYNDAVIKAANEVVVLLKQSKLIESQIKLHHEDLNAKNANVTIARKKLSLGLIDKLPLLSANKTVYESELQAISLEETKSLLQIDLIKALGGGYTDKGERNASK